MRTVLYLLAQNGCLDYSLAKVRNSHYSDSTYVTVLQVSTVWDITISA